MTVCPNCHTNNRAGAKFCLNCGAAIPVTSTATVPLRQEPAATIPLSPESAATLPLTAEAAATIKLPPETAAVTVALAGSQDSQPPEPAPSHSSNPRTDTQPLNSTPPFLPRPAGAIFGDLFILETLVFNNEQQIRYIVKQFGAPLDLLYRACPSPECGAVISPQENVPEKFCTSCGTPLSLDGLILVLTETPEPTPGGLTAIAALHLADSNIRAPLLSFSETIGGSPRFCLITPFVSEMTARPDTPQCLKWGEGLALGLDYLHANGVTFAGQMDESCFGMAGNRPVWSNFAYSRIVSDLQLPVRASDVKALATLVYKWLTGNTQFNYNPNLPPAINTVFERALTSSGFATGMELALAFQGASLEISTPVAIDFLVGRRTDVGMERTLNEDSLMTIAANRTTQSISQTVGVYAIADGMGGHAAGEIASSTIVNVLTQKAAADLFASPSKPLTPDERCKWLIEAVELANQTVFDMRKSAGTDMGSTLVAALIDTDRACIAHVGDSRAYLINDRGIQQISTDHSLVERLIATNQITREEARHHPQRNVIYRTMGDKPKVEVDTSIHTLAIGDRFLLCSDGLSGMVEDTIIQRIVMESPSPQTACDALIDAANAAGGEDNISVVIIQIRQP
jgi:serine/threonine protein phosphatase PrpC